MNLLDIRTILIGGVINDAICALVIGSVWLQHQRRTPPPTRPPDGKLRPPDSVGPPPCAAWAESDVRV